MNADGREKGLNTEKEKLGPFELGKVHCVDALEGTKRLPRGSTVIVTDPHYGIGADKAHSCGRANKQPGQSVAPSKDYGVTDWDNAPPSPEASTLPQDE